ncbi:MAG: hypothetical protein IPN31_00410 [Bacteroidetes bacterium]|nr:hypothetical protein [Bacteroidota bacterium]MBK8680382.1 hypothetical protein [Bacteroidota bacterium]
MIRLSSIELIERHHVLETGTRPLLVHCSDFNYYICKYNRTKTIAYKLATEYLAASFLKLWDLYIPPFNLIQIQNRHLNAETGIGIIKIDQPCFGSMRLKDAAEVSEYYNEISAAQSRKFADKTEFLTIAFFDIWISNDDRNINNYNMLIVNENDGQHFVPIDHGDCFHTVNHHLQNYPITEIDSILSSSILSKLYKASELRNEGFLAALIDRWYFCSESCKANLEDLIQEIPDEWLIPKEKYYEEINTYLFSEKWFETCIQTFREYIQLLE